MKKSLLLLVFLLCSATLFSQTFIGKIIGVKDGDTVVILLDNSPVTIRLAHIDCPEKSQDFGNRAKQFTSDFCFGKMATIVISNKPDRYKRWIAEIFCYNQNLGKELVRNGLAWHFKRYSTDQNYAMLEIEARRKKIGLWSDEHAIAPWDFRKMKRL